MIDGMFDADDDIDSANVRPRALCLFHLGAKSFLLVELLFRSFHSPRELRVPASAYFHSLPSFPFRPGVRVELRASQD